MGKWIIMGGGINKNFYLTKFKQNCVFNIVAKILDLTRDIRNLIFFVGCIGSRADADFRVI
jgi:hypothetical protein